MAMRVGVFIGRWERCFLLAMLRVLSGIGFHGSRFGWRSGGRSLKSTMRISPRKSSLRRKQCHVHASLDWGT